MGRCTKTSACGKFKDVPSTPDGLCKVSCINDNAEGDEIHEFIGPVKIIMVDTSMKLYVKKVAAGAVLVFVNMLIGASVITLLYFSLCYDSFTNRAAHVAFCTLSFQLFVPVGILTLNKLYGTNMIMRDPHRKLDHALSTFVSAVFGAFGAMAAFFSLHFTIHSLSGFFSLFIGFFAVFTGHLTLKLDHEMTPALALKNCHVIAGLVSYLSGSICFATGLSKEAFVKWAPFSSMPTLLLLFVFVTTIIVILVPCQKCINKDYEYNS